MPIDMFPRTIENRLKIGRYVPILRHQSARIEPCGSRHMSTKGEFVEILEFTHFSRVFKFNKTSEIGRKKEIFNEIKVSVVMELV